MKNLATKKALLVGINYQGTLAELKGCVNDVKVMNSILSKHYGFKQIRQLLDRKATTKNILNNLKWLVDSAKPGDVLYFHYSGHGSQVPDRNGDEADRLDEIICPIDLNWRDKIIKDDDFARIFSKVPDGVNLTVVLDCCHSGTGLRGGIVNPDVVVDRERWLPAPKEIMEDVDLDKVVVSDRSRKRQKGILIAGCKSNQTSADAYIRSEKKYMGACTFYLMDMLRRHNYKLDYNRLVMKINHFIKKAGYKQEPQLECISEHRGKLFLAPFAEV